MKYIVEVNAKWLVSVEAESVLQAEHKLLDYNGVWGAMAYDRKMMKTDTFAGAVQFCEMVSMDELLKLINDVCDLKVDVVAAQIAREDAEAEVARLEAELKAAKENLLTAEHRANDAKYAYDKAEEKLGKQRN